MAFQLSLRPQTLTKLRRIRPLSSSAPPDSSADTSSASVPDPSSAVAAAASPPPLPPSCASPSRDIKDRLFKKNHLDKPSFAASDDPKRTDHSLELIREKLRKIAGVQPPKPSYRGLYDLTSRFTPPIKTDQLPSSIFGKEKPTDDAELKDRKLVMELREKFGRLLLPEKLRELEEKVADSIAELNDRLVKLRELEEKVADSIPSSIFGKEKPTDDADPKAPKWEKELREKIRWLRCELGEKVADSIFELNDRLVKLRELEEKVADSITSSIFGKEKPIPKWEKEQLRRLRPEVKLRELEEKMADSIAELYDRLVKLRELEEKVADSIAEPNDRLVKPGEIEMEEKVADSRMGLESLVGPPGNPLEVQGG